MEIGEQTRRQWRDWVARNIGGPEARVEIATQAAIRALGQGKNRDEAAAAALQAASSWKEMQAPANAAALQVASSSDVSEYVLVATIAQPKTPYDPTE